MHSSNTSSFTNDVDLLIRSRCPLIVIESYEEGRVEEVIKGLCLNRSRPCYCWDSAYGFQRLTTNSTPLLSPSVNRFEALEVISKAPEPSVFILRDFHTQWKDEKCCRQLKTVCRNLVYSKKNILVITHDSNKLPNELKNIAEILTCELPDKDALNNSLSTLLKDKKIDNTLSTEEHEKLIDAALGLTYQQSQRAFAKAIVKNSKLSVEDIGFITQEKRNIIKESEALEFYPKLESSLNVGGLESLKSWLKNRKEAFTIKAKEFGLPTPKGIALIGIPGTGKSLSSKMIGDMWGIPLVRLDIGTVFGSYVGESERRIREALALAEAVSPCVLWIDEMEKAFSQGSGDSGTSTRVFGTILTWMSEKSAPCFVVATANDISKLPPELLRRGRFDEIFFLDLPNEEEREAIFKVHLKKRGRELEKFDLQALIEATKGYVGAEIEHAVIDGLYLAFADEKELTTDYLLSAIKRLVPLSVSQKERIAGLRLWLTEGRAKSAS